jgi:ribosomal-protein-alanine N-acetyltransferase
MPEVLAIEKQCFPYPWREKDFLRSLQQRNCIGMVAEWREQIVGYMIYHLQKKSLELLNFAVRRDDWRLGIGKELMTKLKGKTAPKRRHKLTMTIWDANINAHLFFKAMGFTAMDIVPLINSHEGYLMEWDCHADQLSSMYERRKKERMQLLWPIQGGKEEENLEGTGRRECS